MEPILVPLVPLFIQSRLKDVQRIRVDKRFGDYSSIGKIAHNLRGVSGIYGFDELVKIADQLEDAAKHHDDTEISDLSLRIENYLRNL